MNFVIRHGCLVTPEGVRHADLYCADEHIAAIGPNLDVPAGTEEIEAEGLLVFPGGIDAHTHCELPCAAGFSSDDFYQAGRAAICGGTTTLIDFISPDRGESLLHARDHWFRKAEKCPIDYGFHMSIPHFNAETPAEMRASIECGIPSFKVYMAYMATIGVEDDIILKAFKVAGDFGGLLQVHAENGHIVDALQEKFIAEGKTTPHYHPLSRPPYVEAEAVSRICALARAMEQPIYIVHCSTGDALREISRARLRGQVVYSETCPQYLVLDDSVYDKPDFEGAAFVMSPPIRPKGHQELLWNGIQSGVIQTVATDHCPFMQSTQKILGKDNFRKIPNGGGGIENRMGILYSEGVAKGRISLNRFVDLCCTMPAKIYGLYPRKGVLAVGSDADLCLYDPKPETIISAKTHHMNVDRSIYEGFVQQGRVEMTFQRGRLCYRAKDQFIDAKRGFGQFLPRAPHQVRL